MEFEAAVRGEDYRFSFLNDTCVLVSGPQGEYILYKNMNWRCADDLPKEMLREFGEAIDEHMNVRVRNPLPGSILKPNR